MNEPWSESLIAKELAMDTFRMKHLVVPRCSWTGNECDLLVVTADLRIIDVEIKISVADLKADAKKEKWFHDWNWKIDGPAADRIENGSTKERRDRTWPEKAWKHYFAIPAEIWRDDLVESLPSEASGILLLSRNRNGKVAIKVHRVAKPCRDAKKINAEAAIDIARLASLRMWQALAKIDLEQMAANRKTKREKKKSKKAGAATAEA